MACVVLLGVAGLSNVVLYQLHEDGFNTTKWTEFFAPNISKIEEKKELFELLQSEHIVVTALLFSTLFGAFLIHQLQLYYIRRAKITNRQMMKKPEQVKKPAPHIGLKEITNALDPHFEELNLAGLVYAYYKSSFISKWKVDTDHDLSVLLPLVPGGKHNFTVLWGDGQCSKITAHDQDEVKHTYKEPGIYTIILDGDVDGFSFNCTGKGDYHFSCSQIVNILQWGWLKLGKSHQFYGCVNLEVSATDLLDMSGVESTEYMFYNCSSFNGDISHLDTTNIKNMSHMFCGNLYLSRNYIYLITYYLI